jgi:hypothetical protein
LDVFRLRSEPALGATVDVEQAIGEIAVEIAIVRPAPKEPGAFAAHLHDLIRQRARVVLRQRVSLPEAGCRSRRP